MRRQRTEMGGQIFQSMTAASGRWLAAAVTLAAAGAIAISVYLTLAMPMPVTQGEFGAASPTAGRTAQVQAMPDGMMDGGQAPGVEVSMR